MMAVRLLESVQRRWMREVAGVGHLNYQERLRTLKLYSVYGRLMRADLIKCWKVFHSEIMLVCRICSQCLLNGGLVDIFFRLFF